jgi:hypothetical protein
VDWFGTGRFGCGSFGAAWFGCGPVGRGDDALRPGWSGGLMFAGADWVPGAGASGPFGAGWSGGATVSCGVPGSFLVTGGAASEFGAVGAAS